MSAEQTPLNPARTRSGLFCDLSLPTAVVSGAAFASIFGHFLLSSKVVEPNVAANVLLALAIGTSAISFGISMGKTIFDCCNKPG